MITTVEGNKKGCLITVAMIVVMSLFLTFAACAQKDTTITDSTPLLSVKHIDRVAKYLEDKLIAKDYNLIMAALNSVLGEAIKERGLKMPKPK